MSSSRARPSIKRLTCGFLGGVAVVVAALWIAMAVALSSFGDHAGFPTSGGAGETPEVTPGTPVVRLIEIKDEADSTRQTVNWALDGNPRFGNVVGALTVVSLTAEDGTALPVAT